MVVKFNNAKDEHENPKKSTKVNVLIALILVLFIALVSVSLLLGLEVRFCGQTESQFPITKELFGKFDGKDVYRYTLRNKNNVEVKIINYGGIITNIFTPDKNNNNEDVVLGFDTFDGYKNNTPYFGALIGRYANRIAEGHFTLDGVTYNLTKNDGPNALHGGLKGFDKRYWNATIDGRILVLKYTSADMEDHYPGQLIIIVTYELSDRNELIITYRARTTKPTVINLTNHAYFNLAGQAAGTLLNHKIKLVADYYLPVDMTEIPIGILSEVKGTKFDLRNMTWLGKRIPEVPGNYGFDHNFCVGETGWMKHAARVVHQTSGRSVDVYTTQPGLQLYTAYHLQDQPGKGGIIYKRYGAFALEAQHYPDSPNEPSFPTTVLRPEEEYKQVTIYQFGVEN